MANKVYCISSGAGQFLDVYDDCITIRKEGLRQALFTGAGQSVVRYENISSVHVHYPEKSLLRSKNMGYVLINAAGTNISTNPDKLLVNPNAFVFGDLNLIPKVKAAVKYINQSVDKLHNLSNSSSVPDEIRKYKDLLESGIITQDEFDRKKKQLLNL